MIKEMFKIRKIVRASFREDEKFSIWLRDFAIVFSLATTAFIVLSFLAW